MIVTYYISNSSNIGVPAPPNKTTKIINFKDKPYKMVKKKNEMTKKYMIQ